MLYCGHYSGFT